MLFAFGCDMQEVMFVKFWLCRQVKGSDYFGKGKSFGLT